MFLCTIFSTFSSLLFSLAAQVLLNFETIFLFYTRLAGVANADICLHALHKMTIPIFDIEMQTRRVILKSLTFLVRSTFKFSGPKISKKKSKRQKSILIRRWHCNVLISKILLGKHFAGFSSSKTFIFKAN